MSPPATRAHPLRHRLEYVVFRALRRPLLQMRPESVRRFGRSVGRLAHAVGGRRRVLAMANVSRVFPDWSPERRADLVRRCYEEYGTSLFELVSAQRFDEDQIRTRFDIEGWEHLEAVRAADTGCFLVTGHYGTWELAIYPLALRLGRLHIVARPQNNPFVSREDDKRRARFGVELLDRKRLGHRMLNVIRARGSLALVLDQRVLPQNGILVPFLGYPAWTSPLTAQVSLLTGAPLLPVFCVRKPNGRYGVTIHEPIHPSGSGPEAEVELTQRCLAPLEREIRNRPERWLWMHRRWQLTYRLRDSNARRRIARLAGLPPRLTFETLDEAALPEGLATRLRGLVDDQLLERAALIIVGGGAGAGKTHAACAVADALVRRGHPVRFQPVGELLDTLVDESAALARRYRELDGYELLVLDDARPGALDPSRRRALRKLLAQRRGRRATCLTCRNPDELRSALATDDADPLAQAVIIDLGPARSGEPDVPIDGVSAAREA